MVPFRLVYSVRSPDADHLRPRAGRARRRGRRVQPDVRLHQDRAAGRGPAGGPVSASVLAEAGWPARQAPAVFVCGPTGFVEAVAGLLTGAGHDPGRIKTERFGPGS